MHFLQLTQLLLPFLLCLSPLLCLFVMVLAAVLFDLVVERVQNALVNRRTLIKFLPLERKSLTSHFLHTNLTGDVVVRFERFIQASCSFAFARFSAFFSPFLWYLNTSIIEFTTA